MAIIQVSNDTSDWRNCNVNVCVNQLSISSVIKQVNRGLTVVSLTRLVSATTQNASNGQNWELICYFMHPISRLIIKYYNPGR